MAINSSTSFIVSLKVFIYGDQNTGNFYQIIYSFLGKSTFLNSLVNNKENELNRSNLDEDVYEVFVKDFKNNA